MDPITLNQLSLAVIVIASIILGAILENRYMKSANSDYEEMEQLKRSASKSEKQ